MLNAPPPTVSQVKSIRHAMDYRAPSFQGKTVSNFGQMLQLPQIDDLGRPPQQFYPPSPTPPPTDGANADTDPNIQETGTD